MSIMNRLTSDMKEAMKNQEKLRLSVIRMVRGAIRQVEIDDRKTLSDDEIIGVISKEVKMRRDSLDEFTKGNRQDLIAQTQAEIDVLMLYLPTQLTEKEICQLVTEAIAAVSASSKKDMRKVMSVLMPKIKGKADGKTVNEIVQSLLV